MAHLTDIKIADDEASAFFGRGVWDGQAIDALWEEGFEREVALAQFVFTQDQLESVFEVLNSQQQNGGQPKELMNYGVFTWNSEFSTTEPIMEFFMHYVDTAEEAALYLKLFQDLNPLYSSGEYYAYLDMLDVTGTDINSPMCQDGHTNMQFPFGLLEHNITATRQIYDYYREVTTSQPLYNQSIVVFEAYSLDGVKAVDPDSTAFPHRDDNILCDVLVTYDPDSSLDAEAISIGKHITQLWADGQPHQKQHIYVNYAFGDEPLEQMYGDEPWRLKKLRATKAKYDPHNAFRFYNPII
ncbi:hypothetical protein N7527_005523 [Penicillium freii]|nr:hypothetical protein N7527_005523 [Penicillium freii]